MHNKILKPEKTSAWKKSGIENMDWRRKQCFLFVAFNCNTMQQKDNLKTYLVLQLIKELNFRFFLVCKNLTKLQDTEGRSWSQYVWDVGYLNVLLIHYFHERLI